MSIPISNNATVTIPLADYMRLERDFTALRAKITELQQEVAGAKRSRIPTDDEDAITAFRHAMAVVSFAVGNLPPEAHPGWPHEDLTALADLLLQHAETSPDPDQSTYGITLREFAREAAGIERFRSDRRAAAQYQLEHATGDDAA